MKVTIYLLTMIISICSLPVHATNSASVTLSNFKITLEPIEPTSNISPSVTGLNDIWLNGGTLFADSAIISLPGVESNQFSGNSLNANTGFQVGDNTKVTFSLLATYKFKLPPPLATDNWYQEDNVTFSGYLGIGKVNGGYKSIDSISFSNPFDTQWRGGRTNLDPETGAFQNYEGFYSDNEFEYQKNLSVSFIADEFIFSHACPDGICSIPPFLVTSGGVEANFSIINNTQVKFVPSLVPEPETSLMLLVGLGLICLTTKRQY